MDKLKCLMRLYIQYGKMDFLWFLRDTKYCCLEMISNFICAGCTIAGVFLLSLNFDGLGGMNQMELLFMLGFSIVVDGLYTMFFMGGNTAMISRIIGRGQLDHAMIQPVPLWIQLLAQGFLPFSGCSMLLGGISLTCYAVTMNRLAVTPLWLFLFVVYAGCSCLLILSVMYLLSCAAFYAPAAAEEIAQEGKDLFSSLKTYPLGGMGTAVKGLFMTAIPIGLAAWFPTTLLLKLGTVTAKNSLLMILTPEFLYLPAFTLMILLITLHVFKKGMKHYALYGSPRYSGFGHR